MSLRAKLLATYLVFVAALALLGAWSASLLEQAGAVSQRILSENYESVVAAQSMKESLERLDSAVLFARLGQFRAREAPGSRKPTERVDAALTRAAGNITEPGEREVVDAIRRGRDEFYQYSMRNPIISRASNPASTRCEPTSITCCSSTRRPCSENRPTRTARRDTAIRVT